MKRTASNVPYTEADRRYWRTRGNLRVRKKRMVRVTARWLLLAAVHAFVLAALAFAADRIARRTAHAEDFELRSIEVSGLARVPDATVDRLLEPFLRRSLIDLDLEEVAAVLEREPWIREARVRRVLPDALDVRIVERVPVARVHRGEEVGLVDVTGSVLRAGDDEAWDALPWILGGDDLEGRPLAGLVQGALGGLSRLRAARPELYAEILAVRIERDALEIRLKDGARVLLDRDRPERNLDTWFALRSEIDRRVGATGTVDLRWRGRIAVLPASRDASDTIRKGPAASRSGR